MNKKITLEDFEEWLFDASKRGLKSLYIHESEEGIALYPATINSGCSGWFFPKVLKDKKDE